MGIRFCLLPRLGRRHIGSGALARNGDSAGMVEGRRRRVEAVGCFTGAGAAF
jgi:hypothetical protein